jgi:uncharacterized membrane protein
LNKNEFILELRKRLKGLPEKEISECITFYSEIIDDYIEEGLSEEKAVSKVGDIDMVISQIIDDTPLSKIIKDNVKTDGKIRGWQIALLIIGSPVWLSLLIASFSVILSLYISFWAIIISLWSVFVSFIAASFGITLAGIIIILSNYKLSGIAMIAAGLVCAGLSIFLFYGCKYATKGILFVSKTALISIKRYFIKKEVKNNEKN